MHHARALTPLILVKRRGLLTAEVFAFVGTYCPAQIAK